MDSDVSLALSKAKSIKTGLELLDRANNESPKVPDLNKLLLTGESEMLMQKVIQEQGRGRVIDLIAEIQERHGAVMEMEKSLGELYQVFLYMAVMVEYQGQQLNDIAGHVKRANWYVNKGIFSFGNKIDI
ncbi:hypothetical protein MKX01_006005 [Papaver californicum]|nr:hypothetical protein MKX01_006005 [Papaver californicum]